MPRMERNDAAVWGQPSGVDRTFHRLAGSAFGLQRVSCGALVNVTGTYHCDPKSDGVPCIGKVCPLCAGGFVADFQVGERVQIVDGDGDGACGVVIALVAAQVGDGVQHHVRWDDGVLSHQYGRWLKAEPSKDAP